jgi:hypothetical protein
MNEGRMFHSEFTLEGPVRAILKGMLEKATYSPEVD